MAPYFNSLYKKHRAKGIVKYQGNTSLKQGPKPLALTSPQTGLPKTLESGFIGILWVMHHITEPSSQNLSP
jgi:hypothetical protein